MNLKGTLDQTTSDHITKRSPLPFWPSWHLWPTWSLWMIKWIIKKIDAESALSWSCFIYKHFLMWIQRGETSFTGEPVNTRLHRSLFSATLTAGRNTKKEDSNSFIFSHFRQIKRDVKNEKHKELQELVDKVMLNYVTHEYITSII